MKQIQLKYAEDNEVVAKRMAAIFEAIIREREFQTNKYGMVQTLHGQGPGGHELGAWLIILEKELEEAKIACVHGGMKAVKGRNSIRSELVQIAAVCVAALEQWGLDE